MGCANKNFASQGFQKLSPDRQTYIHRDRQTDALEIIHLSALWVVNNVNADCLVLGPGKPLMLILQVWDFTSP